MPAFGKDGIKNLSQNNEKDVWKIVDENGKTLVSCDNQIQAEYHRQSLSQKMNKELKVEKGKLKCL